MERRFEVYLAVSSEHHTKAELSSMLPIMPDESFDKGEAFLFLGKERHRKFSQWAIVERDGDIDDWRATVERLINRIRPFQQALRALPADVHVGLPMLLTEDNDVFGFGLDKHHIEFMASIGAELDMSVVVSRREPGDADGTP